MKHYFVGIFLAQLGVPVGIVASGIANGMVTSEAGFVIAMDGVAAIALTSLFGLILSVPFSLIIGVPASVLLARLHFLNLWSIAAGSLLVPAVVTAALGSLGFFPYVCAGAGGFIYWWYLNRVGALTIRSKTTPRDGAF